MIGFPAEIVDAVYALRQLYRSRRNYVVMNFPVIEVVSIVRKKAIFDKTISTKLFYNISTNTFTLQAPDTEHRSSVSYFDYSVKERHLTRDKDLLFALIRDLKKVGLWDYVSNKDMIIVNTFNSKTDPDQLWNVLKKITGRD